MDTVAAYEQARTATDRVVAGVRPDQMDNTTPCEGWDVRTLLGHLVGVLGTLNERIGGSDPVGGEHPDDKLQAAYVIAADGLHAVIRPAGVLDRSYATPMGELPGGLLAECGVMDLTLHGWDLATATGQDYRIEDSLATHVLSFSEGFVSDQMRGHAFGAAIETPPDATAGERLLAFLGRSGVRQAR
jgi:uncharacterized protein (TIGR03086 family)